MVNFGPMATIPKRYLDEQRVFYEWNSAVTLMRTNKKENERLGKIFAEKANAAKGPVAFLLPLRGVSILDGDGERFCDRETDQVLFDSLRKHISPKIDVHEIDCNINDPQFSDRAVALLLEMTPQNN